MSGIATCARGCAWTQVGNATSHCAACHRIFASTRAFDMHRIMDSGDRPGCLNPGAILRRDGRAALTTSVEVLPSGTTYHLWTNRRLPSRASEAVAAEVGPIAPEDTRHARHAARRHALEGAA